MLTIQPAPRKFNPFTAARRAARPALYSIPIGWYVFSWIYSFASNVWAEGPYHSVMNFTTGMTVVLGSMWLVGFIIYVIVTYSGGWWSSFSNWWNEKENNYGKVED